MCQVQDCLCNLVQYLSRLNGGAFHAGSITHVIGGYKGALGTHPLLGLISFIFIQFSANYRPSDRLASLRLGWCTPFWEILDPSLYALCKCKCLHCLHSYSTCTHAGSVKCVQMEKYTVNPLPSLIVYKTCHSSNFLLIIPLLKQV